MSLNRSLIRLLLARQASGIPPEIKLKARLQIADSMGIALAARRSLALAQQVENALGAGASTGACSVLGSRQKLPPPQAAFANSALVHMLDYDDIHDAARLHPTAVTLPAALAAAELAQGTEDALVEAVALGSELMCRLGVMYSPTGEGPGSDWFLTQLFGYFGACLSAGIMLRLSEDEIVAAFGLAYMQAAGGKEAGFGVGSTARSIYPAFAAMGGVQAALLARAGVTGPESALDGAAGLFRIYLGGEPDAASLKALLENSAWCLPDVEAKPWPSCRLSHPYVAAALAVRAQLPQAPIRRVLVAVNASAAKLCRPLEDRRRPRTLQDAKYSIPFMVAFTLVHGKVDLDTLNTETIADAKVLDLASRVEIAETLPDKPGHPAAEITVETEQGSTSSPKELKLQMSASGLREKFFACLRHAGAAAAQTEALWQRLQQGEANSVASMLETVPRID